LKRAHAVAPNGGEETIGVIAFRPDPLSQPPADLFVIRKQVVEHGNDRISDIAVFTQRQRERYGEGVSLPQLSDFAENFRFLA
jgi:hypothetical protein